MSNEGPARILYDEAGNRVGVSTNPFQMTGYVNANVGVTGPVRVDSVGVTGPVGPVGITGYVQVTGPMGVTGQVAVVGPVGVTGPVRVDQVGGTGPFRVDAVGVTGPVRVDVVGVTGPVRVDRVGVTGFVQVTGPVGVTGQVNVPDPVGVTGPVRVDRVGITGFVQATGPIGVTGLVQVVGAVGVTGPVRVDSVGGTGPFRVDSVGITGPVGITGTISIQGFSGGIPQSVSITDGTNQPVSVKGSGVVPTGTDKALVVVISPNQQAIPVSSSAATAVPGISFGDVALSSITTSVVRRTTYNEQTTNAQRSISSANVNDTSAGTGARQVKITYYDASGNGPFTETVTLNGTTPVNTVSSTICFIEEMEVVSVGSGGQNAGILTLFVSTAGGGGTLGTIAAGDNRTYWCHHYVPNGKTCSISSISVVVNGGGAIFHIKSKTIGVSTAPDIQITDYVRSATQSGTSTRVYGTPLSIVGPARLLMYVTTEANTSLNYRGSFDFDDQ